VSRKNRGGFGEIAREKMIYMWMDERGEADSTQVQNETVAYTYNILTESVGPWQGD
jgi:hypothetical protein